MDILRKNSRYIGLLIVLILVYLSFLIIKPFISAILTSFLLAYIFYPVYKRLLKYIKNETMASFVITLFVLLIILLPLILVAKIILTQAYGFYQGGTITNISDYIKLYIGDADIVKALNYITTYIIKIFSDFIISFPKIILNFLIILFILFYLLKDWDSIFKQLKSLIFLKEKEKIINHIKLVTNSIIYGFFLTAILEGFIAIILFLVFGIPHAFFFGLLTILFVILPMVGAGIIWLPAAIWLAYKGNLMLAILFSILSLVFLSGIENVLRPHIIGTKANVHPIIMLIGIIGGLILFGFIGMVIGPLILSIIYYIIIKDFLIKK